MARRLLPSRSLSSPPKDQTFQVVCSCGETLSGRRETQSQTIPCPNCGAALFVLPADRYAEPVPPHSHPSPSAARPSGGLIDKLNRLAFWTRVRESRTTVGGQLCAAARQMGGWVKRRLSSFRLWMM